MQNKHKFGNINKLFMSLGMEFVEPEFGLLTD